MKNQHTPTRKAARASASTPETARGLASIRPSVAKKVSKVPAKDLLKRSKAFLTKPNKMSPRSERALLRHQRSPSRSVRIRTCFVDLGLRCDTWQSDLISVDGCDYCGSVTTQHGKNICNSTASTPTVTFKTITPPTHSTFAPVASQYHYKDSPKCPPLSESNCKCKPCTPEANDALPCFRVPLNPDVVNQPGPTKHEMYYSVFQSEKPVAYASCVPLPSPSYSVLKCLDISSLRYPAQTQPSPELPNQPSVSMAILPCKGNSSADKRWAKSGSPSLADDLIFPKLCLDLSNNVLEENETMRNLFENCCSDSLTKEMPDQLQADLSVPNDDSNSQALMLCREETPLPEGSTCSTEEDPTMSNQREEQEDHGGHFMMGSPCLVQDLAKQDRLSTQHICLVNDKCPMKSYLDIKETAFMKPPERGTGLYPLPPVCISVAPFEVPQPIHSN